MPIISPTRDIPDIEDWVAEIGKTGRLLHQMGAAEGAAGNISVFLPESTPGARGFCLARFPRDEPYELPAGVRLPTGVLLITGSGRRLRDVLDFPEQTLCAVVIDSSGMSWLHRPNKSSVEPTSELDSHAGIYAEVLRGSPRLHAVVHAQPPKTTYLSHLPEYQLTARFNRQLLRWQPETIVAIPHGVTVLPYATPGTAHQGRQTTAVMTRCKIAVWARHGVIAHSDKGPMAAADLIEYLESAAAYELLDLQTGRQAVGLSPDELRAICERFELPATLLASLPADLLIAPD
jgi:rhamnulose-1-phosphate aldolase